jgi:hypothetical protein
VRLTEAAIVLLCYACLLLLPTIVKGGVLFGQAVFDLFTELRREFKR